jgi:hypothetical protein
LPFLRFPSLPFDVEDQLDRSRINVAGAVQIIRPLGAPARAGMHPNFGQPAVDARRNGSYPLRILKRKFQHGVVVVAQAVFL